jgi:hypothetical protein
MNKNICAVFLLNEAKSLFITKPLYNPVCHNADLLNIDLLLNASNGSPKLQVVTLTKG